jgi:hypothetical protein
LCACPCRLPLVSMALLMMVMLVVLLMMMVMLVALLMMMVVMLMVQRPCRSLLSLFHGLEEANVRKAVNCMRSYGVRLDNAEKNTGKRAYAFNTVQRALFPVEYRCPPGTGGGGVT